MKKIRSVCIILLFVFTAALMIQTGVGAEMGAAASAISLARPNDQFQPLDATLPHFMTLQKFQSVLFSGITQRGFFSDADIRFLNVALNAFMNSGKRENLLLDALRGNRAVELKFKIEEPTSEVEMLDHPTKPLLYRLEQKTKQVSIKIEIRPLLDGPLAFEIRINKGDRKLTCDVNWAGEVVGFKRLK